jgi:regulator of sigma E protease
MMEFLSKIDDYAVLALVFILMISVLVAAHELGHYLFARLFGMGVEEFAVGFGKKPIWVYGRRTYKVTDEHHPGVEQTETTDFTIRPWPLGGFVRIKGMVPEDDGSEVDIPGGFYNKAPWQRFIVLLAGPAFSVLAGIVLLVPLYAIVGIDRRVNDPVIPDVVVGKAADLAGIKPGDRVLAVNDAPVKTFADFIFAVRDKGGQALRISVDRQGEQKEFTITPEWGTEDTWVLDANLDPTGESRRQAVLGVAQPREFKLVPLTLSQAVVAAVNEPVRAVRSIAGIARNTRNFEKTVSGPLSMVKYTSYALEAGVAKLIQLSALLSISVGIFNLLPFAPLDGGQMVVAVIEMFSRRRLSLQMQTTLSAVGMTLIAVLVLGTWFIDFKRTFVPSADPPLPKMRNDVKP